MAKRVTYSDKANGETDKRIMRLLGHNDMDERTAMLRRQAGYIPAGGLSCHVPCKTEIIQDIAVLRMRCFNGYSDL